MRTKIRSADQRNFYRKEVETALDRPNGGYCDSLKRNETFMSYCRTAYHQAAGHSYAKRRGEVIVEVSLPRRPCFHVYESQLAMPNRLAMRAATQKTAQNAEHTHTKYGPHGVDAAMHYYL